MIDYEKINEYVATMLSKLDGCYQLTNIAFDDLFGTKNLAISEKDLHDGFKYIIAKNKKEVDENPYATTEQKEAEKNGRVLILKFLEDQIMKYLKSQNRLL